MAGATLKTLWGLARSAELHMSEEELHLLVQAHTGMGSLRELNKKELQQMAGVLSAMKASAAGEAHRPRDSGLDAQRKKIYRLARALGWDRPVRINGMCRRMFGIASVEWLDTDQCSKLIEALKKMKERGEKG